MTRRCLLALPFASAALAKRWEAPAFPGWSEEFIERIVTNSPWAKPWRGTVVKVTPDRLISSRFSQIGIGLPTPIPGGGWPGRPGSDRRMPRIPSQEDTGVLRVAVDLVIRWASALPVRRALALQEFGRNGLDEPRAQNRLEPQDDIIIELAGIPRALMGEKNDELGRDLKNARLTIPGHRTITPLSVELPTIGMHLTASLRFLRPENIPIDGRTADLSAKIASERIEQRFKLEPMVYEGRLEL